MLGRLADTPISLASSDVDPATAMARERALSGLESSITSVILQPNTIVGQVPDEISPMETIAERLKKKRESLGLSQQDVAMRSGVSQGTIGNIESGLRKEPRELLAIAAAIGVSPHWLRHGTDIKEGVRIADNTEYHAVRGVRYTVSTKGTGFAVEYEDGRGSPIVFHNSWFAANKLRPEALVVVKVSGSAMEPTLYDTDLIVVNTDQISPKDGHVFAMMVMGDFVVKRLFHDGEWIVRSDNHDKARYADKVLRADSLVIGEVVYRQSERI
jgi:phage repressor protein C with HTH and peptisase S24 domain